MTVTAKQSEVQFDEDTHTYTVDGQVVPSVTQILKAAGLVDDRWFNEAARDRGRTVAIAIELHSKGELGQVPDGYQGYVDAWEKFLAETGFETRDVETPRYHNLYGYAGTPDAEGLMPGGRPTVVDVKTGCEAEHYKWQTAGYAGMFDGHRDRLCVYLKPDGSYRPRWDTNPRDWDEFLSMLKVVHLQREHIK